jgi:hypothetical protein
MSYTVLICCYQLWSEQISGSGDFLLMSGQDFLLMDNSNFLLMGV